MNTFLTVVFSILLVVFECLDAFFTKRALNKGAQEANPIIRKLGMWVKIPVTILCIGLAIWIHWSILVIPVLMMVGVCIWNYLVIRRI